MYYFFLRGRFTRSLGSWPCASVHWYISAVPFVGFVDVTYCSNTSWVWFMLVFYQVQNGAVKLVLWRRWNVPEQHASSDVREPISLDQAVLADQPGVARAFALRAGVCRFAPLAPLSVLASRSLNPGRCTHSPMEKICLSLNRTCIVAALCFGKKVTRVKHHCVHYRQKEKSKEKES